MSYRVSCFAFFRCYDTGEAIRQETRLWDEKKKATQIMRVKEGTVRSGPVRSDPVRSGPARYRTRREGLNVDQRAGAIKGGGKGYMRMALQKYRRLPLQIELVCTLSTEDHAFQFEYKLQMDAEVSNCFDVCVVNGQRYILNMRRG